MKCSQVRKNLSAFLDGQGVAGERAGIREHLDHCDECRQYAETLQGVSDAFELIRDIDVPPHFLTHIRQRNAEETSPERTRWSVPLWIRRVALPAGVAFGIALSALIGTSLGRAVYGWRANGRTGIGAASDSYTGSVLLDESPAGPMSRAYDALLSRGGHG
jgi:anti-sigma factor RsiW